MSTLVEIQDAVDHLPGEEKKALQLWLNSRVEPDLSPQEEQRLLRSLDEAVRGIDAGKGISMADARNLVRGTGLRPVCIPGILPGTCAD